MNNLNSLQKHRQKAILVVVALWMAFQVFFIPMDAYCQKTGEVKLEKMPTELERDYALSSLPPHLRKGASVYLMDPAKGYYLDKKGTNGFVCFISRMEWEWGEFRDDYTMPISFDPEGARVIFPVYRDVAAMRASGKFTALQIKAIVTDRIRKGVYKAPSRPGISYMLEPVMRGYPGDPNHDKIVTMSCPHFMFYAPYMNDDDIGGDTVNGPFVSNPDNTVLGNKKGPYGYVILPAGDAEASKILKNNSDLLKRLAAYKPYYKINLNGG